MNNLFLINLKTLDASELFSNTLSEDILLEKRMSL